MVKVGAKVGARDWERDWARDFGAAGLYHMALTPLQILVALITITLFVPCIASLMVMMKERGFKEGFVVWISTWAVAFFVGGAVSQLVM